MKHFLPIASYCYAKPYSEEAWHSYGHPLHWKRINNFDRVDVEDTWCEEVFGKTDRGGLSIALIEDDQHERWWMLPDVH